MTQPIFVRGEWIRAKSQNIRNILNPTTLELIDTIADCNEEDVNHAVSAAKEAQKSWSKVPGVEKAALFHEVARRIRQNGRSIATLMTKETGKPLVESLDCIEWTASSFDYYAEVGRSCRGKSLPPVAPHQINFTVKEPYGVVAAIAPFNFPLLLMAWKVSPAMAAGNCVVGKPPYQNPLSTLLMAKAFEVLPPGVINIITGDGPTTGDILIRHRDIDLVAFTGSTKVGKYIASICGSHLKKVNLELGGIDPLIVFEDADLDIAVKGAAWARLLNAGQVCTSAKRIYLVEKIAEEFTHRLVDYVETLKVGDPLDPTTDIGPLISEEARVSVGNQVARLLQEGAKLLLGGKRCQPLGLSGYFFEPTVFSHVRHGGIATTEEIFGPVITLIVAKDADEATMFANDSSYGLGASIYTKNLEYAMKAMENIKAGSFWINDPLSDNDAAPFGGMRWSGIGRELGEEGLDAFREPKHVLLDYILEEKPYWYPYAKRAIGVKE